MTLEVVIRESQGFAVMRYSRGVEYFEFKNGNITIELEDEYVCNDAVYIRDSSERPFVHRFRDVIDVVAY